MLLKSIIFSLSLLLIYSQYAIVRLDTNTAEYYTELDNTGTAYDEINEDYINYSLQDNEVEYIVESGDTLLKIAQKFYGAENSNLYVLIIERNGIATDHIHIGQKLIIPPKSE